jgi:hypothetical protein
MSLLFSQSEASRLQSPREVPCLHPRPEWSAIKARAPTEGSEMFMQLWGYAIALVALLSMLCSHAPAQDNMTLDFSWAGVPACEGRSVKNPGFILRNAPKSTSRLVFSLHGQTFEYGGREVPYPPNGNVQQGLFLTIGPCNSGDYTWKVEALDAHGNVVATAEKSRQFPVSSLGALPVRQ